MPQAYDVCHSYRPDSIWVSQHALSIRGKRTDILKEDLLALDEEMNIQHADSFIDKINDLVFRWKEYAKTAGVGAALTDSIDQTLLRLG